MNWLDGKVNWKIYYAFEGDRGFGNMTVHDIKIVGSLSYTIINSAGIILDHQKIRVQAGKHIYANDANLSPGIYFFQ